MSEAQTTNDQRADDYEIRPYEPSDRESYLALYETVYRAKSEDWFDWRYAAPYLDHVPIFVATTDGIVAGAEAFLPFRLRAGEDETLALQPADAMVHPDHRRRGLFTRITEAAIDYYDDREPTHFFNFPTPAAKPAMQKLDWREAGPVPKQIRVQRPGPVVSAATDRPALSLASRTARPLLWGYHRVGTLEARKPASAQVERFDGVAVELLVELAGRTRTGTVNVRHDEAFYRWRFANPDWESVHTYVAWDGNRPVAAIVSVTNRVRGMTTTKLLDAQPLGAHALSGEFAALLGALLEDAGDSDMLSVTAGTLPAESLSGANFLSDQRFPLSIAATPTDLLVRPTDVTDGWTLGGRSLTDVGEWTITLADQDVPF